jgi:hypothetical protein
MDSGERRKMTAHRTFHARTVFLLHFPFSTGCSLLWRISPRKIRIFFCVL